ncbi:LOW QUALITY PROTEIN: hypothetical protein ACHAW6_003369 [Cyclotella cf. meneghiniana]
MIYTLKMHVPSQCLLKLHSSYMHSMTLLALMNVDLTSTIGQLSLNNLGQTTCSGIIFVTHQMARYSSDPRQEHGEAILYIKTHHLSLKFRPDASKEFEYYCDADFAGNWNKVLTQIDPSTAKS